MDNVCISLLWTRHTVFCVLVFCVIFHCCHSIDSLDKQFSSLSEQEKPKQFVINQDRKILIVRGKGQIYGLNDKLEKIKNVTASVSSDENDNYLMVIVPNSERLFICQHDGKCEIRNSTDYTLMSNNPISVYTCTQGRKMKTFVGTASELSQYSGFMPVFGSTYCGDDEKNFILASDISNLSPIDKYKFKLKNLEVARNYSVYFRTVIQYSKFILFFTNQKISVNSTVFTSKIIKICKESTTVFRVTYEDIPITCNSGGKKYRLLQHATLLNVSENDELSSICQNKSDCAVIIGIFSSGNDPENPELPSALCVIAVDKMLLKFKESRKNSVVTSSGFNGGYMTYNRLNNSEQYFSDNLTDLSGTNFCSSRKPLPLNVMGNESLQGRGLHESQNTRFTKIESLMTNGFAHVYIGTSDGKLLELHIKNDLESRVIGKSVTVEYGKAVQEMGQLNGQIYAMTENKIVKVGNVNCEKYTNCMDCIKAGIPACGWSILTEKCVKQEALRDKEQKYWLPAAKQKCLTLILDKAGLPAGIYSNSVKITTDPIIDTNNRTFNCKYGDNNRQQPEVEQNTCRGITSKRDHGIYPFYLVTKVNRLDGSEKEVTVAETPFWSYDCTKFDTCKSCVENFDKKITCFWCKERASCKKNAGDCGGNSVNNTILCPALKGEKIRIPVNVMESKTFPGTNIPASQPLQNFKCYLENNSYNVSAVTENSITCTNLKYSTTLAKPTKKLNVKIEFLKKPLDTTEIEVYDCGRLAKDCSICKYYNMVEKYSCKWCNPVKKCQYETILCNNASQDCPPPNITEVSPKSGALGGNTVVVLAGENFGVDIKNITDLSMAGTPCTNITKIDNFQKIQCVTGPTTQEFKGVVSITVNGKNATYGNFTYKDPKLLAIKPNITIKEGGVWLTISGIDLNVGNEKYVVTLKDAMISINCKNPSLSKDNSITCLVDRYPCGSKDCREKTDKMDKLMATFDKNTVKEFPVNFTFVSNPTGIKLEPNKSFASGGRNLTVKGNNLEYVYKATLDNKPCPRENGVFLCPTPQKNETISRQKRSTSEERRVDLHLDGFQKDITITYVPDPIIYEFSEDKEYDPDKAEYLVITGENMNLAAYPKDYIVAIGATLCEVLELNTTYLRCIPNLVGPAGKYKVKVRVGNLLKIVGFVKYIAPINILMFISIGLAVAIVCIIIGVLLLIRKLKSKKEQAVEKIWLVVRENEEKQRKAMQEEFAMMQTTIKDIKQDIVTTGMPFFNFEHYAFNQLFPKEDYDNHILMKQIPVHNDNRSAVEKAMSDLDKLIFNKFFITSVIFTLDKEKKCTMKDKAQFASMLSVLFLSKMDYFLEVIELLLSSLIGNTQKRQQKTLFRRAESISTRLLSDWLSLAIYTYLKEGSSGAHLFMLYKATQTMMENSPIDAVTGDSEITLSQEKLLKDTVETEPLELSVELGDSGNTYTCKVLDCDTIHQAKAKCLYHIYKNKPASEIPQADDVELEWHEGQAGKLILLDISGTNEKENRYLRLNTLKDYCVKQGSQMALVGKYEDDDIYINTNKSHNGLPLDEHEVKVEVDPEDIKWHLIKPVLEDEKVHKPKIADEVYLTRLMRSKLALKEYIDDIFDNVMDAKNMDPAIKYLFSLMDKYGKENDVESETIQTWKSDIYANRIWATLITRPDVVFDIQKATHVEPSLDVIKQALIDSFSMVPHKLGKNSPTQKLLFAGEVKSCQDKVFNLYKLLDNEDVISEKEIRQIMNKFSSQHGQIGFNKNSVLYQLFLFIKSYIHDILADLDENEDTSSLELGVKLDKVIQQMDIEGVGNMNGNVNNGNHYNPYT